jgi:hypothetical protein
MRARRAPRWKTQTIGRISMPFMVLQTRPPMRRHFSSDGARVHPANRDLAGSKVRAGTSGGETFSATARVAAQEKGRRLRGRVRKIRLCKAVRPLIEFFRRDVR